MGRETRAVIDVGTNSVKLLIATVDQDHIHPIIEESKQTRLGAGFFETGQLQPAAIIETAKAVAKFASIVRDWSATRLTVIATSAAREAINQRELVDALEHASGTRLSIISGEQEADWAFKGVCTDASMRERNLLVMDLGGGSTEFIFGRNGAASFSRSFRLGTVRLMESQQISDPPLPAERVNCEKAIAALLENDVEPWLASTRGDFNSIQLIGTGGTPSLLARIHLNLRRYDRELIEQVSIPLPDLVAHNARLWNLPLEARKSVPGLPPSRADVILTGGLIFEQVMRRLNLHSLRVSTRGLRFAALLY